MKTALHNQFGDTIRKARIAKGITLRAAAALIKVSPAYLSSVELNKEGQIPTDEMIRKISSVIGVSYTSLRELSAFITTDLKSMGKKLGHTDAHYMQAFYKAAQDQNLTTKKAYDIFMQAIERQKKA